MSKKLLMTFRTIDGTATIDVDEPKNDITDTKVRAFMDSVVQKNIFNSKSGDYVNVKAAKIVTTLEDILI